MAELPAPPIPQSIEELTPEWLTRVLRAGGFLRAAAVARCRYQLLGEGEGFIGQIVRVELELDRPEPGAPPSLIAKLPISNDKNRALGEIVGAYEREVRFYQELADGVDFRTPRCYWAAMDPNPLAGREERWLRAAERIPGWLLGIVVSLALWLAPKSGRRYVLLLEDLAPARVGDQVKGCSPGEAAPILRELARAQAAMWNSPRFEPFWMLRMDRIRHVSHVLYRRNRKGFFRDFSHRVPPSVYDLADWFDRNGIALMDRISSPPLALMHGDYRLDNMFFDADRSLWLIDWQTMGSARAPYDVAYFLTGNLDPEDLAPAETGLVRDYHDELVARGVTGYDFDACWRDYQLTKLFLLYRVIMGVAMIDLSHERGQKLLDRLFGGLVAGLPTEDLDALLRG